MTTIKAIRIHDFSGIDGVRHEDIPLPSPGPGEVRVRIHAAGVNPVDWQLTQGINQEFLNRTLPTIPGFEVAGVVDALGSGARHFALGEAVYGHVDFRLDGAFAEYMLCTEDRLVAKPANLDFVEAAAVPVAALAAWTGLFGEGSAGLHAGQTVLITAAAGGVGTFAVQFAKWVGARVIATGSAHNRDFLLGLGADEFVDYRAGGLAGLPPLDVVLEAVGGDTQLQAVRALRPGGVLASLVGEQWGSPPLRDDIRAFVVHGGFYPQRLAEISPLLAGGQVRPVISEVLPLAEAQRAMALSKTGQVRGKLVLRMI
ncbi:MAG: NADP-dependent oxidoreductase [Porticoccaceae bacterium]|jgi:NADPH:quinone reductase-like Zn-dependent oxidoreductase|nr:NADP-dependent oxidoreductase [Porticoccaceae bacterium]HLS98169.1 NADP-dependent oxidoreductase [Porticoccaceae bacterium]